MALSGGSLTYRHCCCLVPPPVLVVVWRVEEDVHEDAVVEVGHDLGQQLGRG